MKYVESSKRMRQILAAASLVVILTLGFNGWAEDPPPMPTPPPPAPAAPNPPAMIQGVRPNDASLRQPRLQPIPAIPGIPGAPTVVEAVPVPPGYVQNINTTTVTMPGGQSVTGLFNLDVEGCSMRELIKIMQDTIQTNGGTPPNLMMKDGYDDIQLPPMHLRRVTVGAVLEAINKMEILPGRWTMVNQDDPSGNAFHFAMPPGQPQAIQPIRSPESAPIFIFKETQPRPKLAEPQAESREFQIVNLSNQDSGLSVEDISTAINTAWQSYSRENTKMEIAFHEQTKLMVLTGSELQLRIARKVLEQLNIFPERRERFSMPAPTMPAPPKPIPAPQLR